MHFCCCGCRGSRPRNDGHRVGDWLGSAWIATMGKTPESQVLRRLAKAQDTYQS
jgi:hypothetical protein